MTQSVRGAQQNLPIVFEANQGQIAARYGYRFHRDGADTFFARNGMDVVLRGHSEHPLHVDFVGSNAAPQGAHPLAGHTNYFLGNDTSRWVRNVSLFSEIEYQELYRGISLSFYGNDRELEHDFRVGAGADPSDIALRIREASSIRIQPNGDLAVNSSSGTMILRKPVAYQTSANGRDNVRAEIRLAQNGEIHFKLGPYDHTRTLVIDPVITFATYLAGTGSDQVAAVTTDAAGNILVTGSTTSTDFPTKGAVQSKPGGSIGMNAFITKLDPTGKTLIFSTYLGGSSAGFGDSGGAIAVDQSGNVIVGGTASSNDFPHAGSVPATVCTGGNTCYFIASIKPDGSALNYSGLVGGIQGIYTNGVNGRIAVDPSGNAYLAGLTDDATFPVTPGTLAKNAAGYPYSQMFVLKVDPTGKLVYATVVPGNVAYNPSAAYTNLFLPTGISVDSSGRATVAGWGGVGLPTTPGVVGSVFPNASVNVEDPSAGVVLRLNATASALDFASYLPGTDNVGGMAVDTSGNLWVTGYTFETTLPVSANAYQKSPSVGSLSLSLSGSGYIMKLDPIAANVLGATYLDGTGIGQSNEGSGFSAIALDSKSNVFVGGMTSSPDFPLKDPFVTIITNTGTTAGMVLAEMSPDLSTVEFGSFLNAIGGGFSGSRFAGIAVDAQDHLIATGTTNASDFPTTPDSFEPRLPPPANPNSIPSHTFVAKIDMSIPAPAVCFDTLSLPFGNVNANASKSLTLHVTNCGNAPLDISAITSSDPTMTTAQSCGSLAAGAVCPVQVTFAPVSSATTAGTLTFSDNAVTLPQTVSVGGQGIAPHIVPQKNPVSLGHYVVNTQGPNTALLITNAGRAALSITSVTVSGAGFSLATQNCTQSAVPANSICVIQVFFAPATAGALSGTLLIASNDPQTPQLSIPLNGVGDAVYAVPVLSSIDTPTVAIGTAVTETLLGSNFYPQSVAQLNGVALTTTFVSGTTLSVKIPANAFTGLGEQILTVVNPQPAGGTSTGIVVTPYQMLTINASFLVSAGNGMLYASIPANASSNPNTVIAIDPTTGATGTPIAVGKGPSLLAASSDGSYLFVANQADFTVQRINLKTNAVERTFAYTPNLYCSTCTNLAATDLVAVPGNPQEVILSQGSWLTLYNDAGAVNHVPSDGQCCTADPDFGSIALAGNPLTVYGLPFLISGQFFQMATVSASGLSYTRPSESNLGGNSTTGSQVISDGTLLYTSAGQIWNPATQAEVGTFTVTTPNTTSYPNIRNITLDSSLGEFYTIGDQTVGSSDVTTLTAFGLKSHAIDATLLFPQINAPTEDDLVRWGTNGFGFLAENPGPGTQSVYLVRSSAVSGSTTNPTPVLTTLSPNTATAGGASFTLTANGSSFLTNSVIEWNGVALTTSFVSAQQLTATVPVANIAQAGTAQVSVYTPGPGGGSSAAIALTIISATPAASLSSSSLSFGNVSLTLSGTAQTVQLTNPGSAALTISSIAATGDFSQTNTCGSSVAAGGTCTISVIFKPSATGSRTGTLTVTDNAPTSPQTVTLTGTGVAALTIGAAPGGSTSATVTGGGTATYNLSIGGGPGLAGTVSFSCTGAPQYATCTVAPTTVTVTSGSTANVTVTVTTTQTISAISSSRNVTFACLCLAPLSGLLWCRRKRRFSVHCALLLTASVLGFGIAGCASGSSSSGSPKTYTTPAGAYNLTVTATAGSASTTQSLTLNVN